MNGTKVRCKFSVGRSSRSVHAAAPVLEAPEPPAPKGPSRPARMLALAHHIERLIDAGELKDYVDAASAMGVTRARLTQLANLLLLAPEIQEHVLLDEHPIQTRVVRRAAALAIWSEQQVSMTHDHLSPLQKNPIDTPLGEQAKTVQAKHSRNRKM